MYAPKLTYIMYGEGKGREVEERGRGGEGKGRDVQFHHLLLSNLTTEASTVICNICVISAITLYASFL